MIDFQGAVISLSFLFMVLALLVKKRNKDLAAYFFIGTFVLLFVGTLYTLFNRS